MIAGLPVRWVNLQPPRAPHMPAGLLGRDMVYVQGFDGSQPQHPMHARHVHWANVVAYALAHDAHDQSQHHRDAGMGARVQDLLDISKTSIFDTGAES